MGSQPEADGLELLPRPRSVDRGSGAVRLESCRLEPEWSGARSERLSRAVERLSAIIADRTGLTSEGADLELRVQVDEAASRYPGVRENEDYWLAIDDAGLYLHAPTEWGALRGLTTLGQLVRRDGTIPFCAVDDGPRFPWRGLLIDPARHFLPAEVLLRTLEGMAACKLNVLHLHLSDDQGFRLPVPEYPRLASAEAYTADELAAAVAHASDLGIRVVPEIDMPGHVTSWLVAYPELGAQQVAPTDRFGVHAACLDPTSEDVYRVVDAIFAALTEIFPDPCVHIGGDEVSPRWWSEDPSVASLMKTESLPDLRSVQGYFNRRVAGLLEQRGRRLVAWDEVLGCGPDPEWIVQAWRGATARDSALAGGHPTLVSAPYYLDLHYPADVHYRFDPCAPQGELMALEDELLEDTRFRHVAGGLAWTRHWREDAVDSAPDPEAVLGGEACLWGELVDRDVIDMRLWTRLPAVAERFWSPADVTDPDDLHRRLAVYLTDHHRGTDLGSWLDGRLDELGIRPYWRPLVAMLEPVKWYARLLGEEALNARLAGREMPQARPYGVHSSLGRLVDCLPVESALARELAGCTDGAAASAERLAASALEWQRFAEPAEAVPEGLVGLAAKLARLGTLIENRLAGSPAASADLDHLTQPDGELMIAMPPRLRDWLLNP
jgi:hexosaminidase